MDILVSRPASLPGDNRNGESRHPFGHPSLLGFQMIDRYVQGHVLHFEEPAVDGGDNLPPGGLGGLGGQTLELKAGSQFSVDADAGTGGSGAIPAEEGPWTSWAGYRALMKSSAEMCPPFMSEMVNEPCLCFIHVN
jgi:hypothetical protein